MEIKSVCCQAKKTLFITFVCQLRLCVKYFPANKRHHNQQPIRQIFTLRVTTDRIGCFGWLTKHEFNKKVSSVISSKSFEVIMNE